MKNTESSRTTLTETKDFFDSYARALIARDATAVAEHYAVPALVLFPGQSLPVTDAKQTEDFFASSFGQYDGVQEADADVEVIAETQHSRWARVAWSYDGQVRERFVYQLVRTDKDWRIAVLTLLE